METALSANPNEGSRPLFEAQGQRDTERQANVDLLNIRLVSQGVAIRPLEFTKVLDVLAEGPGRSVESLAARY